MSHIVFHTHLKIFLSQSLSFHSHLSFAQAHLLEFDHTVFGSHWRCVGSLGEYGRFSRLGWLLGAL